MMKMMGMIAIVETHGRASPTLMILHNQNPMAAAFVHPPAARERQFDLTG